MIEERFLNFSSGLTRAEQTVYKFLFGKFHPPVEIKYKVRTFSSDGEYDCTKDFQLIFNLACQCDPVSTVINIPTGTFKSSGHVVMKDQQTEGDK